jgi:hypothetical protein
MFDHKWSPRRVDSNVTNPERLLFLGNSISCLSVTRLKTLHGHFFFVRLRLSGNSVAFFAEINAPLTRFLRMLAASTFDRRVRTGFILWISAVEPEVSRVTVELQLLTPPAVIVGRFPRFADQHHPTIILVVRQLTASRGFRVTEVLNPWNKLRDRH